LISKILVADPKTRLTPEQIMAHPWMSVELSTETKLSSAHGKTLLNYISIRKEQSQKFRDENPVDD